MTTKLTQHFTLEEMCHSQTAVRLNLSNFPDPEAASNLLNTAAGLEKIRKLVGKPIFVSSGYRSPKVNKAVGGARNSQHMTGQAADITCHSYGSPRQLMQAIVSSDIDYDQCILEFDSWCHISFSNKPRKQNLIIDSTGTRPWDVPVSEDSEENEDGL